MPLAAFPISRQLLLVVGQGREDKKNANAGEVKSNHYPAKSPQI